MNSEKQFGEITHPPLKPWVLFISEQIVVVIFVLFFIVALIGASLYLPSVSDTATPEQKASWSKWSTLIIFMCILLFVTGIGLGFYISVLKFDLNNKYTVWKYSLPASERQMLLTKEGQEALGNGISSGLQSVGTSAVVASSLLNNLNNKK